jgi:chorismate dehydratase
MPIRVDSVAFINSRPLIRGLDREPSIQLTMAVPSRLIDGLAEGRTDVALLPVIDYQRLPGLRIVPASCIGCFGPTLTVRLFCRVEPRRVTRVACDTDSHTSVALARVIFAKRYGTSPDFVDLPLATGADDEARLLIGDKVICEPPAGYPIQIDLGEAWRDLTGLPFVFAIWTARAGIELGDLPRLLRDAKERGLREVDEIVATDAVPRGWPADVARQYLTEHLKFDVGPRQLEAIDRFHAYAEELGIIPSPRRPLQVVPID